MTNPLDSFELVLADFKSELTPKERQDFQFVTLNDVREAALRIQRDQENLKTMMNISRLESFLEAMNQFGEVLGVFANANVFVAFVWGLLKFILHVTRSIYFLSTAHYIYGEDIDRFPPHLSCPHRALTGELNQTASTWSDTFESILDAYSQIGEHMPLVEQYKSLFGGNLHMRRILALIYTDILKFHKKAVRMLRGKSGLKGQTVIRCSLSVIQSARIRDAWACTGHASDHQALTTRATAG